MQGSQGQHNDSNVPTSKADHAAQRPACANTGISIGFDAQIFRLLSQGGISRYFSELIAGINKSSAVGAQATPLFRWHGNRLLTAPNLTRLPWPVFWGLRQIGLDPAQHTQISSDILSGIDMVHATYYQAPPPHPQSLSIPLISTLHDMTPELMPEHVPQLNPHRHKQAWLEVSNAVVSVSHATASALQEHWPHLADRLHVIHLGTPFWNQSGKPLNKLPTSPFLLFVGRRDNYKQASMLWKALSTLGTGHLVMAGGGALKTHELRQLKKLRIDQRVHTVNPCDSELAWLYRNCAALLVPSLSEGFSLPLIESLACDAPIIASDIAVHREIGKEFAHLISPQDIHTWQDAITTALSNKLTRPTQLLNPNTYTKLKSYYSTERMVAEHLVLYNSLKR